MLSQVRRVLKKNKKRVMKGRLMKMAQLIKKARGLKEKRPQRERDEETQQANNPTMIRMPLRRMRIMRKNQTKNNLLMTRAKKEKKRNQPREKIKHLENEDNDISKFI